MNALFVLLSPYLEYIKLVVSAAAGCWGAYTWMDKRNKQSKVLQYAIADALVVAQAEVNRLERELAEAIRFDPHHWLVLAKREKKDRNDGRFAAVLLNSTAERKKDLFEVFASLSKHFLTLYAGSSDEALLFDATRFGNIAFNLQPNDPEIKKIVAELAILGEIQNLTYIPGNHDLFKVRHSEELDPLMISSLEALEFIARLKQDTRKYFDQQLLLCAAIAAERAHRLAIKHSLASSDIFCETLLAWANMLIECGHPEQALPKLDTVCALLQDMYGNDGRPLLIAQYSRARALFELSRFEEALSQLEESLPRLERTTDPIDNDVVVNHHLRAIMLGELKRIDGLKEEAKWFQERGNSDLITPEHLLQTRCISAQILYLEGQPDVADKLISEGIKQADELLGEHNRTTANLRANRAILRRSVQNYSGALVDAENALDALKIMLWPTHPEYMKTAQLVAELREQIRH